jgi:hypothetical protein
MPAQSASDGFPWGFTAVLVLALLLYAVMALLVVSARSSDAAGNGMTVAFAAIFGVAVWIVLLILLLMARHGMPDWAIVCIFILLPLSAIAAATALGLFSSRGGWPKFIPVLLPIVFLLFAAWARFPGLQGMLPASITSASLLGTAAVLTVAPFIAAFL